MSRRDPVWILPFGMGGGLLLVSIPMAGSTLEGVSLVVPALGLAVAGIGCLFLGLMCVRQPVETQQPQVPARYHIPRHTPLQVELRRQWEAHYLAEIQARDGCVIDLEPVAVRPELPAA